MHSTMSGTGRVYYKSLLLFACFPFLMIQSTYRFYVAASFFSYSPKNYDHAFAGKDKSTVQKKKVYTLSGNYASYLTLDKRYHHKNLTDTDNANDYPGLPVIPNKRVPRFFSFVQPFSPPVICSIFSPRAPPVA